MKIKNARSLTRGALIAALYVALTFVSASLGLAGNAPIQLRLSEALTILPFFCPEAIWGLFVGCMLSNLLISAPLWDILFGSLATLIGAIGARLLRRYRLLVPLPTILSNAAIVPFVLIYAYGVTDAYWFLLVTVTIGEVLSAGVLGLILLRALEKRGKVLFTK